MTPEPIHVCVTSFGEVRISHRFYNRHVNRFVMHEWEQTKSISDIVSKWAEQAWLAGVRLKYVK